MCNYIHCTIHLYIHCTIHLYIHCKNPHFVSALDAQGRTPLHLAAASGDPPTFATLRLAGGDVHATTPGGAGVLHFACGGGSGSILRQVMEAGVDVGGCTLGGDTALMFAAAGMGGGWVVCMCSGWCVCVVHYVNVYVCCLHYSP